MLIRYGTEEVKYCRQPSCVGGKYGLLFSSTDAKKHWLTMTHMNSRIYHQQTTWIRLDRSANSNGLTYFQDTNPISMSHPPMATLGMWHPMCSHWLLRLVLDILQWWKRAASLNGTGHMRKETTQNHHLISGRAGFTSANGSQQPWRSDTQARIKANNKHNNWDWWVWWGQQQHIRTGVTWCSPNST